MKNSIKYVAVALAVGSMASCADLDTEYQGGYVSTEQKEDALSKKPELASASVAALYTRPCVSVRTSMQPMFTSTSATPPSCSAWTCRQPT